MKAGIRCACARGAREKTVERRRIEGPEQREGFVAPLFTTGKDATWAPSGIAFSNGKLYAAALRGTAVLEFDPDAGLQRTVITGYGRIRDVRVEGRYLYFITNNTDGRGRPQPNDDKLYRIPVQVLPIDD